MANRRRWRQVLAATYESARLSGLAAVRNPEDVLAGYRDTGAVDPWHWLLVRNADRDAGCLLLADHPRHDTMEVLYLGLIPAARGRGCGKQLARGPVVGPSCRPAATGVGGGCGQPPAAETYMAVGFQAWQRRRLYVKQLASADHWHASFRTGYPRWSVSRRREFRRRAGVELRVFSEDSSEPEISAVGILGGGWPHARFDSVASIARIKTSLVTNGDRRGEEAPEVTKDDMEIVSTVRTALADKVGQERFDLWFGAGTRLDYDGRALADWRAERVLPGVDSRRISAGTSRWRAATCWAIARRSSFTSMRPRRRGDGRIHASGSYPIGGEAARGPARGWRRSSLGCRGEPIARRRLPLRSPPAGMEQRRFASLDTFVAGDSQSSGRHLGRDGRPPAGPAYAADVLRADQRGQDAPAGRHLDGVAASRTNG